MFHMQQYIEAIDVPNTAKVAQYVFNKVTKNFDKVVFEELTVDALNELILGLHPKCRKEISIICYIFRRYAEWLYEQGFDVDRFLYANVQAVDQKKLWNQAKPKAGRRFISYADYKQITHDIGVYEDYNSLYYETLFSSIFEGIYSDDMSVLKNLRGSDIDGTTVTLHEDNGHTYKLTISEELSKNLQELAQIDIWKRPNKNGICNVSTIGLYPDTVFKIEKRVTSSDKSQKFSYYGKLRRIKNEYIGHSLSPLNLYASGIVYRAQGKLEKYKISLKEAFADNCRNRIVYEVITGELIRCNGVIAVENFRELVKGHIDDLVN